MTDEKFTHVHTHSYYSLLDGLTSPKELAKRAKELGFKSLALTDHGTCGGLYQFQKACKEQGIKPILGMEAYICKNHLESNKDEKFHHTILLAKNHKGLQNLMTLSTIAELKGKYRKPRIDFDLISKYHEGLIMSTACAWGEIPQMLVNNSPELRSTVGKYKEVFKDDFYFEIMKHKYFKKNENSIKMEKLEEELHGKMYQFAKEMGVKAIATNDIHYARKTDQKYHDILLCIQTRDVIKNPKRFTFDSDDFYMKSYEEMMEIYHETPDLLSNTVEISEKIEESSMFQSGKDLLPIFNLPDGVASEADYLKSLVKDGMIAKRFIDIPEYRDRIKFEMQTILKCGYTRYFLILWDVINWARSNNIRIGCGRGCFLPENQVVCKDGVKDIKDVKIGDRVLAYDSKWHDVINTLQYDVDEEIIEIEIEDGRKISCTLDHKIHVVRNGELIWLRADELTLEDEIYDIK